MFPSWGGRKAGEARDKAGLAYTLMGRADAEEEEEGCFLVSVNMHMHPTPVRQLLLNTAMGSQCKRYKKHHISSLLLQNECIMCWLIRLWNITITGFYNPLVLNRK